MKTNIPTVYTDFEGDSLFGNRAGFENLRDRIDALLQGEDSTILLYDNEDEDFEEFFTWLSLKEDNEDSIDTSGSSFIAFVFLGIFILGVIFAIIGIKYSLSWLINI